jgi:murein DD-endopeptidase MepM/ murein hydrolase activator NlpD
MLLAFSCQSPQKKNQEETQKRLVVQPKLMFNLPVDSFFVVEKKVKNRKNLADILLKQNINYNQITQLVAASKKVFDVRKIKAGNKYYLFKEKDSLQTLRYFVYEKNRMDYVVFDLADSIRVWQGQKKMIRLQDTIQGEIKSSLWNAMIENKANPELANVLSDIFGWSIDFFGIQKGDAYKVYYEKLVIENDTFGIGKVFAARFRHLGTDYKAFYFVQDSVGEYFDEYGKSLRKTFLKAPLKYRRISSRFSNSRYHPVLKIRRPHHGVDYAAASGTPVHSIGDGVVTRKGYQKRGGGNYLYVKHNGTYTTSYMHLRAYAKGIRVGKHVKQGELIGFVGQTGLATGPHLDFRVYKNGRAIDPLKLKSPSAKPVDSIHLQEFFHLRDSLNPAITPPVIDSTKKDLPHQ